MTGGSSTSERNHAVLNDEYNPLKPNDYDDVKARMRRKAEEEKREKREK
jgi:hypothetical protein